MADSGNAYENGDFIDDLIGIRNDLRAIRDPFGNSSDDQAAQRGPWEPSRYKERPKTSSRNCLRLATGDPGVCSACVDVCPVDAITIGADAIQVSDMCRKCGLCIPACPMDVFSDRHHLPKVIHDEVAKVAGAYERCYITCTRALGHAPDPNVVVLPCVGAVPPESLLALLTEFGNISVYLPFGVCDKCRTTTGEQALTESIAQAEQLSGRTVGLEMDEDALDHTIRHSYERAEFVKGIMGSASSMVMPGGVVSGASAIAKRIQQNTTRLNALDRQLDQMVGATNASHRRRTLTRRRKLLIGVLQKHPELAGNVSFEVPACDATRCTVCGACEQACPINACDVDEHGRFNVASAYCVGCGACVSACPEDALEMRPADPADLLVPDEEQLKRDEQKAKQKAEIDRLKAEGKKRLQQGLDFLEGLDTGDEAQA